MCVRDCACPSVERTETSDRGTAGGAVSYSDNKSNQIIKCLQSTDASNLNINPLME